MHADEDKINQVTQAVIGAAFRVGNTLGHGFLEKVYENALAHELRKMGLRVRQQHPIPVFYDGVRVGKFDCDLLVEETVLVELKSVRAWDDAHTAQCLNYLTATRLPLCLLINFGQRVDVKRFANFRPA
jgi:GxxExxY protein